MGFSEKSAVLVVLALVVAVGSTGCAYETTLMAEQAKTSLHVGTRP